MQPFYDFVINNDSPKDFLDHLVLISAGKDEVHELSHSQGVIHLPWLEVDLQDVKFGRQWVCVDIMCDSIDESLKLFSLGKANSVEVAGDAEISDHDVHLGSKITKHLTQSSIG